MAGPPGVLPTKVVGTFVLSSVRSKSFGRLVRLLLTASLCTAFTGGALWASHSLLTAGTSLASGTSFTFNASTRHFVASTGRSDRRLSESAPAKTSRLAVASLQPAEGATPTIEPEKAARHALKGSAAAGFAPAGKQALDTRFDRVVEQAALTPAKLASLFGSTKTGAAKSARATRKEHSAPAPERFASLTPDIGQLPHLAMAYADPSTAGTAGALAALSAVAPTMDDSALYEDESEFGVEDDTAILPDTGEMPSDIPLPLPRPRVEQAAKPAPEADKPRAPEADEPSAPRLLQRAKPKAQKPVQLAFTRPNEPDRDKSGGGLGNAFRGLFNPGKPRAGNGVAVYDISAAKVYMPDGSVLEAHSGIGKMADNPRYTHVKMNGATPPHTYNLKMREKRFHGVEAIRMLPVDGKNKHGRDGFLTHSYLLRGGRAESHGCVAFKDYKKFLNAFKQGKIKQLVVVPGGGAAKVRIAKNGSSA